MQAKIPITSKELQNRDICVSAVGEQNWEGNVWGPSPDNQSSENLIEPPLPTTNSTGDHNSFLTITMERQNCDLPQALALGGSPKGDYLALSNLSERARRIMKSSTNTS